MKSKTKINVACFDLDLWCILCSWIHYDDVVGVIAALVCAVIVVADAVDVDVVDDKDDDEVVAILGQVEVVASQRRPKR